MTCGRANDGSGVGNRLRRKGEEFLPIVSPAQNRFARLAIRHLTGETVKAEGPTSVPSRAKGLFLGLPLSARTLMIPAQLVRDPQWVLSAAIRLQAS